jgi:hypothetical protein
METYIDLLMQNHPAISDSETECTMSYEFNQILTERNKKLISRQNGGNNKEQNIIKNKPSGSFPPLFPINKKKEESEETEQEHDIRAYEKPTNKTAVSIKEIMEERRNDTPFIAL